MEPQTQPSLGTSPFESQVISTQDSKTRLNVQVVKSSLVVNRQVPESPTPDSNYGGGMYASGGETPLVMETKAPLYSPAKKKMSPKSKLRMIQQKQAHLQSSIKKTPGNAVAALHFEMQNLNYNQFDEQNMSHFGKQNSNKKTESGWERSSIDSGGNDFAKFISTSELRGKPNQDIQQVVDKGKKGTPCRQRMPPTGDNQDLANETAKSGYRLLQRTKQRDRVGNGSPDMIGGGDSATNLQQIKQASQLEQLNSQMGASNSAAYLTKYLELNNLYPSDLQMSPDAKDYLKDRKPSTLLNNNSYITINATEIMEGGGKRRRSKRKMSLQKSPTLNTLSQVPSTSSFGGSSFLKPRFCADPKAREALKNTNLGNQIVLNDIDTTTLRSKQSSVSRNAANKYHSMRVSPPRPIELYGDAKEQVDRESSVGRMVCGFTRSPASIPFDKYTEQQQKNQAEEASNKPRNPLTRNIHFITPEVSSDFGFIVPSLLLHNSGGGQFFQSGALKDFNRQLLGEVESNPFSKRSTSVNQSPNTETLTPNDMKKAIDMGLPEPGVSQDTSSSFKKVPAKIVKASRVASMEATLLSTFSIATGNMTGQQFGANALKSPNSSKLPQISSNYAAHPLGRPCSIIREVSEVDDSYQIQPTHPISSKLPYKARLSPLAMTSLRHIPQSQNLQLALLNEHHQNGTSKFHGTDMSNRFLRMQDPTLRAIQQTRIEKEEAEKRARQLNNYKRITNEPDVSVKVREFALEQMYKKLTMNHKSNPAFPSSTTPIPEMSFNLARKTYKEYLAMKRGSHSLMSKSEKLEGLDVDLMKEAAESNAEKTKPTEIDKKASEEATEIQVDKKASVTIEDDKKADITIEVEKKASVSIAEDNT